MSTTEKSLKELCLEAELLHPTDWLELKYKDLMVLSEAQVWTVPIDHARCQYAAGDGIVPATLLFDTEEPTRHNNPELFEEEDAENEAAYGSPFGEYEIQPRDMDESMQDYSLRMLNYGCNTEEEGLRNLVCSIWFRGYKTGQPWAEGSIYHYEQDCPYGMEQFTTVIRDWFNTVIRPLCILKIINEDCAKDTLPYGIRDYDPYSIGRISTGSGVDTLENVWKWLGGNCRYFSPCDHFPCNVKLRHLTMPEDICKKYRTWLLNYVNSKDNDWALS